MFSGDRVADLGDVAGGIPGLIVTVATGRAIGLKRRKFVGGFAALLCKGFRCFPQVILLCIVPIFGGGSQTASGHRALSGFKMAGIPTRWGYQLNGNLSISVLGESYFYQESPLAGDTN